MAQLEERLLETQEVTSSNLVLTTMKISHELLGKTIRIEEFTIKKQRLVNDYSFGLLSYSEYIHKLVALEVSCPEYLSSKRPTEGILL